MRLVNTTAPITCQLMQPLTYIILRLSYQQTLQDNLMVRKATLIVRILLTLELESFLEELKRNSLQRHFLNQPYRN